MATVTVILTPKQHRGNINTEDQFTANTALVHFWDSKINKQTQHPYSLHTPLYHYHYWRTLKTNYTWQSIDEIPCRNCSHSYVGQDYCHISKCWRKSRLAVTQCVSILALTQHVTAIGHSINFKETKLLIAINHKQTSIIREQIEIE